MSAKQLPFAAVPGVDAGNPYPGLQAFGESDRAYFHGRDQEREDLFRLVRREVLTVLFGRSGLGKTSLLNAGLFPLLRQADFLPLQVRLDFTPGKGELVGQVRAICAAALREQEVDARLPAAGETLWEYFHQTQFWSRRNRLLTPLLLFDQFEEIFTVGRRDERVGPLVTELADLIENHIPDSVRERMARSGEELAFSYERQDVRVVLSLREDFLPQLEGLLPRIPSLARNRYRLLQMDGHQALAAILKPGGDLVGEEVARAILHFVAGASREDRAGEPGGPPDAAEGLADMEVEPALLSLFCRELNDRRRLRGLPAITAELVHGTQGEILSAFYDQCLADMARPVRTFVEERLLTGSGFRQSVPVEEALQGRGLAGEDLAKLVDRRLLRLEDRLGRPHVELIHDVMTRVIRESRDRRRARETHQRQLRRASLAAGALLAVVAALVVFSLRESRLIDEADRQGAKAQQQRLRAAGYRARAEEMVRYMLFDLYQHLATNGDQDLVRELTGKVLAYLANVEKTDTSERLRSAALTTLGDIDMLQHKTADAERNYREALAITRTLYRKEPANRFGRRELAVSLKSMSDLLDTRGDHRGALDAFTEALSILKGLALHPAGKDDSQAHYDSWTVEQADLVRQHQRLSTTLATYGAVVDRYEKLAATDPANRDVAEDLAIAYQSQAETLNDRGDCRAALGLLRKALGVNERLAQEVPGSVELKVQVMQTRQLIAEADLCAGDLDQALAMADGVTALARQDLLTGWKQALRKIMGEVDLLAGDVLLARGDVGAALSRYQGSAKIFAADVRRAPDQVVAWMDLSSAHFRMGNADARRGEGSLARREWSQAVEVISPWVKTDGSDLLDGYARSLIALGRLDEARPVCEKLREREWNYRGLQDLCRSKGLL